MYWKGDDDLEYFTLRCRNEEQLRLWETQLNRLIHEVAARRTSDGRGLHMRFTQLPNSTSPAPSGRQTPYSGYDRTFSVMSSTTSIHSALPSHPSPYGGRGGRYPMSVSSEDQMSSVSSQGPMGYPPFDGFEHDGDGDGDGDDDFEDYPPASSGPTSGRGTPMGSRQSQQQQHFPSQHPYARASASGTSPLPPMSAMGGFPAAPNGRPPASRMSEASYSTQRPALRSQFSSTKLRTTYEKPDVRASGPSPQPTPTYPTTRSRSASQPSAYVPRGVAPPSPNAPWGERPPNGAGPDKRGSGSSQSTGDGSSDYSPNSSSPITPFGSSDSSLSGMTSMRSHHEKVLSSATEQLELSVPVKVKVHFHEDIFVIQVPRATEYEDLVEKVGKKIRLCGPRRDDGPLRWRYKDEDGDLVSLGSTEDVQMAFEAFRPGSQVTLYVQ